MEDQFYIEFHRVSIIFVERKSILSVANVVFNLSLQKYFYIHNFTFSHTEITQTQRLHDIGIQLRLQRQAETQDWIFILLMIRPY